jgi:hypothetical protein
LDLFKSYSQFAGESVKKKKRLFIQQLRPAIARKKVSLPSKSGLRPNSEVEFEQPRNKATKLRPFLE